MSTDRPPSASAASIRDLSESLRRRRKDLKLSQAAVAARLGLSQERVSAIERSPDGMNVGQLLALTRLLGLEVYIGLGGAMTRLEGTVQDPPRRR